MSLFVRHEARNSTQDRYERLIRRASYGTAGVYVDSDSAMRHDAVWSCRTRIAQDVSMMPVDVVRYVNGQRQEVTPTPQIIAAPSVKASAMDWRYQVVDSWLADGNAWGLVTATTANGMYPLRIELTSHCDVRVETFNGLRFYVNDVEEQLWPVGRLWHVPAYTVAGQVLGLSPIGYHRATIGVGLAAEKYGADFFDGGGHPTGILAPSSDPGPEQAASLKEKFAAILRGSRDVIVVPQSTVYTPIQSDPTDSQFIDTMRYSVEQVCRIFGEDPADHGASSGGSSLTYANRSDADLARFKRRQFWVTKLQNALTELVPRPQVVKLNTSSSLMMTTKERHELHKLRLESKTRTVNEVRILEDETPFAGDDYDEPGIPGGESPTPDSPSDLSLS
jgi:HK97 family phage portal protein